MTAATPKDDKKNNEAGSIAAPNTIAPNKVTLPQASFTKARNPSGRPKDDRASLNADAIHAKGGESGDSGDLGHSFSARLRELRRAEGLSLRKLEREIGVTANAVLCWEKDEVTPTRCKMLELSGYLGAEPA